ncbi:uncharacterized protein LOC114278907 [Camellia sinensis]|uniref:uncharacterized protein LOC114278907 n=1 Tax=Camellia sinensis TaxID=4442 RepID=UPI001036D89D|nr:uncharacterized protein LOC114278907 [Camellia sinensis]
MIVNKYWERIRLNPNWPIKSLADTITTEHNVKVDLQKVRRAKIKALTIIEGTASEQFAMLWGYVEKIRSSNPGTTISMKVKEVPKVHEEDAQMPKFKRLYLKKSFQNACRPVIGVDGCHLKRPHGGVLLTVVGMDANNCIFLFAYAIIEKEKKKTRLWFLNLLGKDLNIVNSHYYTFISDKQKGLIDAVAELFPNVSRRFCVGAVGWIPRWNGGSQYEVVGPYGEQYKVDLKEWTCGCRKWDLSGLHCVHVVAAANYMDEKPKKYVHHYYKVENYLRIYKNMLTPINGRQVNMVKCYHLM